MSRGVRVKTRPRFEMLPFSADRMQAVGSAVVAAVTSRIKRGRNVQDEAAKPLTQKWARKKLSKGLSPRRTLTYTGEMLNSIQVDALGGNRAVLRFADAKNAVKAAQNNAIDRQWGMSKEDRKIFRKEVKERAVVAVVNKTNG